MEEDNPTALAEF
jgi:hypothetical protein